MIQKNYRRCIPRKSELCRALADKQPAHDWTDCTGD